MGFFDLFKKKKPNTLNAETEEVEKLNDKQASAVIKKMEELSRKSAYKLTIDAERKPTVFDTKFGGTPYWDMSLEYPVSSNGEKLLLLAQINLADVKDCELLPSHGMLQFFIIDNDLYGMDFKSYISNDTFRVIYHDTINEAITEEEILSLDIPTNANKAEDEDFLFPFTDEVAVNVVKAEVSVGVEDFMFEKYLYESAEKLGIKLPEDESAYDLLPEDIFDRNCNKSIGHRLFGYAHFTQSDPREYMVDLQDYILLFQMDSDYVGNKGYEILWGDAGVGNFFIKTEDLEKLDFTKVMYTWDCC